METKILLDSVGGYFIEPRGLLVVDVSRFGSWIENEVEGSVVFSQ